MGPGKKSPGRPTQKEAANAKACIVYAACLHFARHGIKGSSNKIIALEAGVTPAMIHYYFPEKSALYVSVLEASFKDLLLLLPAMQTIEEWVHGLHQHLRLHPWLPHLMLREVLTPSGLLRPLFMLHFAPALFGNFKRLMTQAHRELDLGETFDIDRHIVLLMGMLLYPFMSIDIAQNLTGRAYDEQMLDGFRDDALRLFRAGLISAYRR